MNSRPTFLLFLAVAVTTTLVIAAVPPLTLDIRVQTGTAPFTTQSRVTVTPDAANRYLCLHWEQVQGGMEERTSCLPLEGEQAALTYWQYLKSLSSGKWEVQAWIVRNTGSRIFSNRITLRVLGPNYESDSPLE